MQKKNGPPLIFFGIILIISGIVTWVFGNSMDNDYKSHIESVLETGQRSNTGTTCMAIGIGLIIIGVIISIIGIVLYATSGNRQGNGFPTQLDGNIGTRFDGRFANSSRVYEVEINSDGSCLWRQKDEYYEGTYRYTDNNEWTIYIDGYGEAFKFQIKGEDVFVTGGPVNERFFREAN